MSPEPLHPVREELFAYRDGELPADRRVLIEAHVLTCRSCRELIDEISSVEAALRARPDSVGEGYFERLSEAVMKQVGAEGVQAPAPLERRKNEAEATWEEKRRRAPRLSWALLLSIGSGAAAVLVVVVLLARERIVMRNAPPAVVLERSAPDAARVPAKMESTTALGGPTLSRRDRSAPPSMAPAAGNLAGKSLDKKDAARSPEETAMRDEAADRASTWGKVSERKIAGVSQSKPETEPRAAPMAAAQAPTVAGAAARESGLYPALLQRYGLPPLWGPGVSDQMILRAEPALRELYRTGGAAPQDSARVRLYLAEAARVRAGASPDSAAIGDIARHYRRAISLARDPATASVARSRLADFLREVGLTR